MGVGFRIQGLSLGLSSFKKPEAGMWAAEAAVSAGIEGRKSRLNRDP